MTRVGLVLAVILFLAAGCSKKNELNSSAGASSLCAGKGGTFAELGLSARVDFKNGAPKKGVDQPFTLRFWCTNEGTRESGPFIDPKTVLNDQTLRLWMPDHEHGSDPLKIVRATVTSRSGSDDVVFEVSNVIFSMPEDWVVQLVLMTPDNRQIGYAEFPFHI